MAIAANTTGEKRIGFNTFTHHRQEERSKTIGKVSRKRFGSAPLHRQIEIARSIRWSKI